MKLHNKIKIKGYIKNVFGPKKNRVRHHGRSDCEDIIGSGCQISIVFDVGANIGVEQDFYLVVAQLFLGYFSGVKKTCC